MTEVRLVTEAAADSGNQKTLTCEVADDPVELVRVVHEHEVLSTLALLEDLERRSMDAEQLEQASTPLGTVTVTIFHCCTKRP